MILLICAILGGLIGLMTGGSLRGIGLYALRGILLPVAAYLLKAGAAMLLPPQTAALEVCLVQYILLFVFIFLNYQRPLWPLFAFLGTLMNFLAIALNGGCMPVSASLYSGAGERLSQLANGQVYAYCLANETTRLPMFGDIIRLGHAASPLGFASIGDLVLCIGVGILCWQMTRVERKEVAIA
jgi:hypothetical protein